jgi:two-component system response regulator HydG
MPARKLLYVSDQACPKALEGHLVERDWQVVQARGLPAARALLQRQRFLVGLLALDNLGPGIGEEFEECAAAAKGCEWVGMFPRGAMEIPALRDLILGRFFDHHTQPPDPHFLCQSLGHAFGRAALRSGAHTQAPGDDDLGMVGRSPAIVQVRRLIRKAGPTEAPVLIGGESGSGKELVAQALHGCSSRADGPFVAINCGALAPSLIHSELFGHERGSFSGASADKRGLIESARGGTLFLDEIAELPLDLQTTLLRFLQEKTIQRVGSSRSVAADTRVVAASHVDLAQAVAAGRFRDDLFYRLNVLPISVPPLRERTDDIPLLAQHFYERCVQEQGCSAVKGFGKRAMATMMAHDWPGNVRELFNRVHRAVVMTEQSLITPDDLGLKLSVSPESDSLQRIRVQAEKSAICLSLDRVSHNVTMAARELGVSRMTLYRLMAKHSITAKAA